MQRQRRRGTPNQRVDEARGSNRPDESSSSIIVRALMVSSGDIMSCRWCRWRSAHHRASLAVRPSLTFVDAEVDVRWKQASRAWRVVLGPRRRPAARSLFELKPSTSSSATPEPTRTPFALLPECRTLTPSASHAEAVSPSCSIHRGSLFVTCSRPHHYTPLACPLIPSRDEVSHPLILPPRCESPPRVW
jgi:hypothetical protein